MAGEGKTHQGEWFWPCSKKNCGARVSHNRTGQGFLTGALGLNTCRELNFARSGNYELEGAFLTPSLRNIAQTAPYFHVRQFARLHEVIVHYNDPPRSAFGLNHLTPLELSEREIAQLEAFLRILDSPPDVDAALLMAPAVQP